MNNNIDGVGGSDNPETPETPESNVDGAAASDVDETGGESTAEMQAEDVRQNIVRFAM